MKDKFCIFQNIKTFPGLKFILISFFLFCCPTFLFLFFFLFLYYCFSFSSRTVRKTQWEFNDLFKGGKSFVPFPVSSSRLEKNNKTELSGIVPFPLKKTNLCFYGDSLISSMFYTIDTGWYQNHFIIFLYLLHQKCKEKVKMDLIDDSLDVKSLMDFQKKESKTEFTDLSFHIDEFLELYGSDRSKRQLKILESFLNILKSSEFTMTFREKKYKIITLSLWFVPLYMVNFKTKTIELKVHPLLFSTLAFFFNPFRKYLLEKGVKKTFNTF